MKNIPLTDYLRSEYEAASTPEDWKIFLELFITKLDNYDKLPQDELLADLRQKAAADNKTELFEAIYKVYLQVTS